MRRNFGLVEKAAEEFVGVMLPADKARIGSFSNRIQVDPRDFTSNHEELLGILRSELQEAGSTPLWNAVNVGITALLHQQGRRVVLVFTDGMDSPMNFSGGNNTLKDVMKRAEEEDVMHSDQERLLESELHRFVRYNYEVVLELARAR